MLQKVEFINFTKKECISISLHFISIVDNQAAQKFDDNSQKIFGYRQVHNFNLLNLNSGSVLVQIRLVAW